MSFGGTYVFPEIAAKKYKVKRQGTNTMLVNRQLLPAETEVWFLVNEL